MEAKDLPQGSAAGDLPLPIDWEMSKPLVLPTREGKPWELASSSEEELPGKGRPLGQEPDQMADQPPDAETVTTDLPKESSREVSVDRVDSQPGPEDPVGPALIEYRLGGPGADTHARLG